MNRKTKKWLLIVGLLISMIMQFIGVTAGFEHRFISGTCLGIAAVMLSLCINKLYRLSYEKEFPDLVHQEEIELRDERNTLIRLLAKSKSSDIVRWFILILAWLNFILKGILWLTFALIGVYLLIYILEWYFTDKYQREM